MFGEYVEFYEQNKKEKFWVFIEKIFTKENENWIPLNFNLKLDEANTGTIAYS